MIAPLLIISIMVVFVTSSIVNGINIRRMRQRMNVERDRWEHERIAMQKQIDTLKANCFIQLGERKTA